MELGKNLGIITQTSLLRVFDPIEMHDVIETLQRTLQRLGLDPNQVLAAIDDTHLPAPSCLLNNGATPNLNDFLDALQTQIQFLINAPDLPLEARQTTLLTALSALQQFQHSLQ